MLPDLLVAYVADLLCENYDYHDGHIDPKDVHGNMNKIRLLVYQYGKWPAEVVPEEIKQQVATLKAALINAGVAKSDIESLLEGAYREARPYRDSRRAGLAR